MIKINPRLTGRYPAILIPIQNQVSLIFHTHRDRSLFFLQVQSTFKNTDLIGAPINLDLALTFPTSSLRLANWLVGWLVCYFRAGNKWVQDDRGDRDDREGLYITYTVNEEMREKKITTASFPNKLTHFLSKCLYKRSKTLMKTG